MTLQEFLHAADLTDGFHAGRAERVLEDLPSKYIYRTQGWSALTDAIHAIGLIEPDGYPKGDVHP